MTRLLRLLAVLLVLPALVGCDQTFTPFALRVESDSGTEELSLKRNSRVASVDGRPSDEASIPLRLSLRAPVENVEDDRALLVRVSSAAAGLSVIVRDDNGELVARSRPFESTSDAAGDRPMIVSVPLSSGRTIAEFEFALGDEAISPVRLLGLSLGRPPVGVGTYGDDRSLYASPGVVLRSWDRSGIWDIDRSRVEAWGSNDPVEFRYHFAFEPPTGAELLPVEIATAQMTIGGERFELELRPGRNRAIVYPSVERVDVTRIVIESEVEGFEIEWIGPTREHAGPLPRAVPVDMGTLVRYRSELWRQPDFELFSWTLYPDILILDSATYAIQSRFFRRLAFFVEKAGYRGTLLSNEELAGRHGYNAHNYDAGGLAGFFNEVRSSGVVIHEEEELLRDILLAHGVIRDTSGGFVPGSGGVLGVSRESAPFPALRELLISHEAYHGVYYAVPQYLRAVDALWEALDEDQQRYWRLLLSGMQYDVDYEYLVRNEYHAYLLQQPIAEASWYFESRVAERIARWHPGSAAWLESYLARYRGTHRDQALRVQSALYEASGLVARDVYCIERIPVR